MKDKNENNTESEPSIFSKFLKSARSFWTVIGQKIRFAIEEKVTSQMRATVMPRDTY